MTKLLDIKEKIIQVNKRSDSMDTGISSIRDYKEYLIKYQELLTNNEKDFAFKIESGNEATLEIKEEIVEDYRNLLNRGIKPSDNRNYQSEVPEMHQSKTKQKIFESNVESEKKYKCEKCARTYGQKKDLNRHRKFECDVIPQFRCNFCGKLFKRIGTMSSHVDRVHHKTYLHTSKPGHTCDQCSRSYRSLGGLYQHKRLDHGANKPQFICYFCGHKTNQKSNLSKHITARHSL
ncbi:zinc finger protein 701-like [Belonocnema kinseyi]|uniref:zinc finger protein 701-like n=1 Tax=Belonocnema kinseyi TaxID=2817044 RepID=UPI00143DD4CC|nr:zinc finger protein 701-like [Belonocnema kinseyi]